MSNEVLVPALGESITEASIAKWVKNVGESVSADEVIVELETDKITLEVNASVSGVISEILFAEGDTVNVGQLIAKIEEGAAGTVVASASVANNTSATTSSSSSAIASPAANKIAKENNVNLDNIAGSGKDNRVTKNDVNQALNSPTSSNSDGYARSEEVVRMSKLRQSIAKRLKESQNNAAMLTTFNEIDMSGVIDMRKIYKDKFEKTHGVKLGFMSFFVKAATAALQEIPSVNAEIQDNNIIYKNYCDIGVAVGGPNGLVVPIIRDAQRMNFAQIESQIIEFGQRAKEGTLSISDMTGGTFTISNGGVYGSMLSTPIINPPQSAILGMHRTVERPVVVNGEIKIRPIMYAALSYDHRIIDGKEAVTFLFRIKEMIENPERLLFNL